MRILVADDEQYILEEMLEIIKEVRQEAQIKGFISASKLLEYAKKNPADVAFLDIEMGHMSGIEVAKQLKQMYPKINIIFATGYDEYMKTAIKMRASGYITKPVKKDDVEEELNNLRNPVYSEKKEKIVIRCFGNFDIFVNGESVKFERTKTKELLAYLVDRCGSSVTSGELCAVLWEDAQSDRKTNHYLQILKKDLITSLKKAGAQNLFIYSWNKYAINKDIVSCDYFDYIADIPDGVRAYNGEYMSQYSWGEDRNQIFGTVK